MVQSNAQRTIFRKLRLATGAALFLAVGGLGLNNQSAHAFAGGDGSADAPFQISTCLQLQDMQEDLAAHYELVNNIDCGDPTGGNDSSTWNGGAGYVSPGAAGSEFSGSFDGNGYTVTDLYINRPTTDHLGLIGYAVAGTVIERVGMVNVNITGQRYAGGIAGVLGDNCIIRDTYVTGNITLVVGEVVGSGQYASGITSGLISHSHIYNSYSTATITTAYASENYGEGGVTGFIYDGSTVENSFWDTEVSGEPYSAGGTGKTTVQLKTPSTFRGEGWNFASIWGYTTGGYPYLRSTATTGNGTALYPYLISDCEQLQDIDLSEEAITSQYKLSADIDCDATHSWNANEDEWVDGVVGGDLIPDSYSIVTNNGYQGFMPIGSSHGSFRGVFDGDGHSINNLWIFRKNTSSVGLFNATLGATVTDLVLDSSSIVGASYTGGLVGYATSSTISNVSIDYGMTRAYLSYYGGGIAGAVEDTDLNNSTVLGGNVHGSGNIIGGLVGYLISGFITDSTSSADVDGGYSIGGAIGLMSGGEVSGVSVGMALIHSDYSENEIYPGFAKSGNDTGGFVGRMYAGLISSSTTAAHVEGEGVAIGGFAGTISGFGEDDPVIETSSATGSVTGLGNPGNNSNYVGGFVGANEAAEINHSFSTGLVTVDEDTELYPGYSIGGFSGSSNCGAVNSYNHATGSVTAPDSIGVGGFSGSDGCEGPGSHNDHIYATGNVVGDEMVGGLIGQAFFSTISQGYATGDVAGAIDVGGLVGNQYGGGWDMTDPASFIVNSFATGSVTGGTETTGGLVGRSHSSVISDSYAIGAVEGSEAVGGLVGTLEGKYRIANTYAAGALTSDVDPEQIGGLVAVIADPDVDAVSVASFWDADTTGTDSSAIGEARTTSQMTSLDTFTTELGDQAWDFSDVWSIAEGEYPCLIWAEDGCSPLLSDTDLNGDSIPDVGQPNVIGYTSEITNKIVVVDAGADCTLTANSVDYERNLAAQDAGYDYANGLLDFAAGCTEPGFTTTIKLYFYDQSIENLVVRKYNESSRGYAPVTGATLAQQTINGHSVAVATYQLADNGPLDTDPAEGSFADPVGLGNLLVSTPNTGFGKVLAN